ncbi:PLP-dependent aminotransferase family protein [Neoaquamicrobium sediminum]|uniref:aminotransferase-like domain-containing protein n=1 Tax=Neoaquamicrobium sediminum TaxID=1849104 RepID=UPI003BAC1B77
MTNWLPDLSHGTGPLYTRLADRIEADIGRGVLPPGGKLPPQRDLAYDLGVTIGTVGRAYAVLRERGLVNGEVGRGTYVLGENESTTSPQAAPFGGTRGAIPGEDKLRMDSTAAPEVGQAPIVGEFSREIVRRHPDAIVNYVRAPTPDWLEAGGRWLATGGWRPSPETIVPTLGGHAAILAVIAAVTAPGDRIAFDQLTYSSVARSANLIGRRILSIGADGNGTDPGDFERLCAQQHPKLAFLIPGLHNPTLTVMPENRRREIVEIARKHNVWLVEDAIYAALLEDQPVSIAELAPERTFHVGGLSKTVAAGVRAGWVACPPHLAPRVQVAYKMLTGGNPFLMAELAARLVLSGQADAIRSRVAAELQLREKLARDLLAGHDFASHDHAPFLWLKLAEPWLSGTFRQAAANEGVLIDDEDEFRSGRTEQIYHRVRVGFSSLPRTDAEDGFNRLRSLLDNPMAGYDSYG